MRPALAATASNLPPPTFGRPSEIAGARQTKDENEPLGPIVILGGLRYRIERSQVRSVGAARKSENAISPGFSTIRPVLTPIIHLAGLRYQGGQCLGPITDSPLKGPVTYFAGVRYPRIPIWRNPTPDI
jgi:hypothetical protein